jgi:hypothetical protein
MSYAAKNEGNNVRIVDTKTGNTFRMVTGPFVQAIVQGNELHATQRDGRIKIVDIRTGNTIRLI